MKIAILAWGSLYWDKKELEIHDTWNKGGVVLPIEFARISNDGRLTLVISEQHGTELETYWSLSKYLTLNEAIENLRKREETNLNSIGYVNVKDNLSNSNLSESLTTKIKDWAISKSVDAAIWTGLKSNFFEKLDQPFSIVNAKDYLDKLEGELRIKAFEYIKKAPILTQTELRIKLNNTSD